MSNPGPAPHSWHNGGGVRAGGQAKRLGAKATQENESAPEAQGSAPAACTGRYADDQAPERLEPSESPAPLRGQDPPTPNNSRPSAAGSGDLPAALCLNLREGPLRSLLALPGRAWRFFDGPPAPHASLFFPGPSRARPSPSACGGLSGERAGFISCCAGAPFNAIGRAQLMFFIAILF